LSRSQPDKKDFAWRKSFLMRDVLSGTVRVKKKKKKKIALRERGIVSGLLVGQHWQVWIHRELSQTKGL